MSYYAEHKEEVLKRARSRVKCECGATVSYSSMSYHKRSSRHIIWLQMTYWKERSQWLEEQKKEGKEWTLTDNDI